MTLESFREYCLALKGVSEELPFDDKVLVFKVLGKVFALTDLELFDGVNLKCDPEKAIELREKYASVTAGYHMNKKHWNTIAMNGEMPDTELKQWIDHSYQLVVSKLPKKQQQLLTSL